MTRARVDLPELEVGYGRPSSAGITAIYPRMPERLDEEELADCAPAATSIYQLPLMTIGARLAVAE